MNPAAPFRVIIVEDQPVFRQDLEDFFQAQPGFTIIGACGTVHEALVLIHTTKPDLLLLDIGLPDGTGFDILERMSVRCKVIFLTAHQEYAIRAIRYGAIDYLLKPLDPDELKVPCKESSTTNLCCKNKLLSPCKVSGKGSCRINWLCVPSKLYRWLS